MNFTPIGDRVIIEADQSKEVTDYGLIIPQDAVEKSCTGTVLSVGPDVNKDTPEGYRIEPGMKVCYGFHGSSRTEIDGTEVVWIRKPDIHFSYK